MPQHVVRDAPVPLDPDVLHRAAEVIKCLGHPLRLRLVEALDEGERSVSELQTYADSAQSAVSQQLAVLKAHAVVDSRRDGAHVYYRIIEPKVTAILSCIRSCDLA